MKHAQKLLVLPWALPCKTAGEQIIPSGLFPQHIVLFALLSYCCHTAPLLGGKEPRMCVTYTLPWSSAWEERGVDRPVSSHPSTTTEADLRGQVTWNYFELLDCVRVLRDTTATSRHPPEGRLHSLILLREWDSLTMMLWFYSLPWWCSSLDSVISAWMVWTDTGLFSVGFFLHLSFIKDFVPVSQTTSQ